MNSKDEDRHNLKYCKSKGYRYRQLANFSFIRVLGDTLAKNKNSWAFAR